MSWPKSCSSFIIFLLYACDFNSDKDMSFCEAKEFLEPKSFEITGKDKKKKKVTIVKY
jgi:hypothetical protein